MALRAVLHLIQSNRMEALAEQLCSALSGQSLTCGFSLAPQTVLVQSPGMAQWLKLFIASQNGIAANLNFPLPSSFIWELYRAHVPHLPEESPFTKPNMVWKLMTVLPAHLEQPAFAPLKRYLAGAEPIRLYQLCQKIADVFDQYLVYRPEWILAWELGDDSLPEAIPEQHLWQPQLWRSLLVYAEQLGQPPLHRANLHTQLIDSLQALPVESGDSPVYVFGLSAMPVQQLEVLRALSHSRDVYIFWANPSEAYWGDVVDEKTLARVALSGQETLHRLMDVGNPLLASWGKMGRDYLEMLIEAECEITDCFVEPQPNTLLEQVHCEIFRLEHRGSGAPLAVEELFSNGQAFPKISVTDDDHSIRIRACHSAMRELETLQNHLLSLFDRDPTLRPADIVVMMPDIAQYAALIEGVFGSAEEQDFIPYAISDRSSADISPLLAIIPQLFALHQSRLTVAEVLGMLEVPAVMRKFDLQQQDIEHISRWLEDVGVRWGWDAQDKQRWQLPGEVQNTFRFGLDRLLTGYAMLPDAETGAHFDGIAPYADIEGQQTLALGKLVLFCDVLEQMLVWCQQSGTLEEKVANGLAYLDALFEPDEADLVRLTNLRQGLSKLTEQTVQYRGEISQDIFLAEVQQLLSEKGVSQRFLAGAVNFCTLMPMRSIPFKHVCLLGLNDEDYPRDSVPVGFDLMRLAEPRKGDRSRKQDDRYLFLEAILAAREGLYLSYQGASARDNSERVPSVLLSELVEYLQQAFCMAGDLGLEELEATARLEQHLLNNMPLQPFSEQLFRPEQKAQSYHKHWFKVADKAEASPSIAPFWQGEPGTFARESTTVQLASLIAFCSNPAKALFRERWHASLDIRLSEQQHSEPFALDGLARYQLFDQLMAQPGLALSDLRAQGALPYASLGEVNFLRSKETMDKMQAELLEVTGGAEARRIEIDLDLPQGRLQGWLDQIFEQALVFARPGKIRGKDRLALWLSWLSVCASEMGGTFDQAHYVGVQETLTLPSVAPDAAKRQLGEFLSFYQNGLSQYWHFYPESGWQWLKSADKNRALQTFNGNLFAAGEGQEPHIHRMCPDLSDHFDAFTEVTDQLLAPLYAWEQQ